LTKSSLFFQLRL